MWQAIVLFLLLGCVSAIAWPPAGSSDGDLSRETSVGETEHEGRSLLVFGNVSYQFAEPSIKLEQSCPVARFQVSSQLYEMYLPARLTVNTLKKAINAEVPVATVTITDVEVKADPEMVGTGSNQVRIRMILFSSGKATLQLQCPTFERCQRIKDSLQLDPAMLQRSVRFTAVGRVRGIPVRFPASACDMASNVIKCDDWIPIMRRADNSFSFARSWNEYVAGFGSADNNKHYWIGLQSLHLATNRPGVKCKLRVEAESASNRLYWEEVNDFRVEGAADGYRLSLGSHLGNSAEHAFHYFRSSWNVKFSTYDKDNDDWDKGNCAKPWPAGSTETSPYRGNNGGWWYHRCSFNFLTSTPMWTVAFPRERIVNMSRSAMMFSCQIFIF